MRRQPDGMNAMDHELTQEEIDRQFQLWRTDPKKLWEVTNKRVVEHPDSPNAYFGRHQAWKRLGRPDLALADLDKSLSLEDHSVTHDARGKILRELGRYHEAIEAHNRSEHLDPQDWRAGFGPLFRADCYARLGDEAAALADCATLPDDHWTPGMFGLPAGNKQEVAAELRRRAAAARSQRQG
jgi:tetratricopeptide (TPR) repeat protein